jgi:hypothetical protein
LYIFNRDHSPSNKASIENSSVGSFQQAGGDIINNLSPKPRIDIAEFGTSGGADGTFLIFKIKNDGSEAAIDIQGDLVADNILIGNIFSAIPSLSSGGISQSIKYRYDNTDFFTRQLINPLIVFRYKDRDNNSSVTRRRIIQKPRADGRYNLHEGDLFFPENVQNERFVR